MNIVVYTSGFFHLLFGILLLINIENILIQRKDVIQSVKVEVISETDYKKMISEDSINKSKPLDTGKVNFVNPITEKNSRKMQKKRR